MKKRISSINEFANEHNLNESIKSYEPAVAKELEKMFMPLIKRFDMEVKEIRPDSLSDNGTPSFSVIEYNVIKGGSWVSGSFFNQKDADAVYRIFNETEIACAGSSDEKYGAIVQKDTFRKTIFWNELKSLAKKGNVKLDFDEILNYAKEHYTSVK